MSPAAIRGWLLLIVAIAGMLGAVGLGRSSLWVDEVHSVEFSALPSFPLVVLNAAARDAYPPLYFTLLHGWMAIANSEVWLRGFSLLCHLATIPVVYAVGRRLVGAEVGLVAAALVAVNPFHLAFAREVRMYSGVALLAILSIRGLLGWTQSGSRRDRAVVLWTGLAMLYTHFICALLLFAEWLALRFGHAKRGWMPGTGRWVLLTALAFLPWSPLFLKSLVVTHGYGAEAPAGSLAFWFLSALGAGFAKPDALLAAAAVVTGAATVLGLLAMPAGPGRRILALWAFVPPGVELLSAVLGKPVFGERTLIVSTPAWLILAAIAIVRSGAVIRWAVAVPVMFVTVVSHVHELRVNLPEAPAHREGLAAAVAAARRGDAILHSATVTYHAAHEYYLPRLAAPGRATPSDFIIEPKGEFRSGRLGTMFRDGWRSIRARLDPAGAIRTGTDPSRIPEDEFMRKGFRRVIFLRTDADGARRLWRLIPSVYYPAQPGKIFTRTMADHPRLARAYRLERIVDRRPGLVIELWVRP